MVETHRQTSDAVRSSTVAGRRHGGALRHGASAWLAAAGLWSTATVAPSARAGEGPWTLQPGEHNLYLGLNSFRYGDFDSGGTAAELSTDVIATGGVAVWTHGLAEGLEMELQLPYESARVGDPSVASCRAGPRRAWCAPTAGLGDLALLVKTRFLDEVYAAPLTMSAVWGVRTGEAYSGKRGRLTTLGDGQTDFGGTLALGRTDVLGRGWYRAGGSVGYWWRVPHTVEPVKIPADELRYDLSVVVAVVPSLSVGPAVYGFHRLGGVDLGEADLSDINGFASLDAAQALAGAKVGLHPPGAVGTVSLGVLRTVAARNNPTDTLAISLGVGFFLQPGLSGEVALPELLPPEG